MGREAGNDGERKSLDSGEYETRLAGVHSYVKLVAMGGVSAVWSVSAGHM